MNYFKINGVDYSMYTNKLKINKTAQCNTQTNAAGDTVVDILGAKRSFEIGIIPLNNSVLPALLNAIDAVEVNISILNPVTNVLEENIPCMISANAVEYYTIQVNKVMYKAMSLTFTEL